MFSVATHPCHGLYSFLVGVAPQAGQLHRLSSHSRTRFRAETFPGSDRARGSRSYIRNPGLRAGRLAVSVHAPLTCHGKVLRRGTPLVEQQLPRGVLNRYRFDVDRLGQLHRQLPLNPCQAVGGETDSGDGPTDGQDISTVLGKKGGWGGGATRSRLDKQHFFHLLEDKKTDVTPHTSDEPRQRENKTEQPSIKRQKQITQNSRALRHHVSLKSTLTTPPSSPPCLSSPHPS